MNRIRRNLAFYQLGYVCQVACEIVRIRDVTESESFQLRARIADDLAQPVVDEQPMAIESDLRNSHRRGLESRAETLLACGGGLQSEL